MHHIANFIDGRYCDPIDGHYLDVYEPGTGTVYAKTPNSGPADLNAAMASAKKAFPSWSRMTIAQRSKILLKLADLIEENLESLAAAESKDSGKPLSLAKAVDIPRASKNFRFYGSVIAGFSSEAHLEESLMVNYTRRAPIGVVGCISPWNLPLYLFSWKIAPALAMGNCVIGKPSEVTPMTAYLLGELAKEAGLPPGVLNILHGEGKKIGKLITENDEITAISFTGGTATGQQVAMAAAAQFKKVSLELGGKNPTLVFADCDLDEAVKMSVKSAFTNQGQICLAGSRILVEDSLYDTFKEKFVQATKNLIVERPDNTKADLGAIVSEAHLQKIESYVELAISERGMLLSGGQRLDRPGYYFQPTVIEGLNQTTRTNQEEIFGPVVTLDRFHSEEEAIEKANCTRYGLSATLWTSHLKRAHRVAHELKAGIVWVNCWLMRDLRSPFGGMKDSGVGREGGYEALRFFSEPQNICIRL